MTDAYLVFSQTGTIPSRVIRRFTKDPFNHVSFSYDLETLYSFARKYNYSFYPGGFIEEHLDSGVFGRFPNTHLAIARIQVDPEEINAKIERESHSSGYNYIGLVADALGLEHKTDKRYCSQFVNVLTLDYDQICVTPGMLYEKHKKDIIWEGTITEFLQEEARKQLCYL